jgi:hypothetical protein
MKKLVLSLAFVSLLNGPTAAHDPVKGPNGGMVVDAGPYHLEMVAQNTDVSLFVSDGAYKPISAAGFKAVAILLLDGKSHRVELRPAEGGRLSGKAPVALPKNPKGAVQLNQPDGKTAQARFN